VSPVTSIAIVTLKRQYPHVGEIVDFASQQSIKLLWDRIFELQEQLTATQATITQLVAASNVNESAVETAQTAANEALAIAQEPIVTDAEGGGGGGGGGGGELPGGGDGGQGDIGCSAGLPSGHDTGGLLNAIRAGQLVCGTGNEFAALRNPTATVEERFTNAEELLRRCIWHLREAGFSAGRQQNPSGAISKDKLTVVVDEVLRAYDIFIDLEGFTNQMQMHMGEVGPAQMVDDGGIPD
jgi:hypothetical protein